MVDRELAPRRGLVPVRSAVVAAIHPRQRPALDVGEDLRPDLDALPDAHGVRVPGDLVGTRRRVQTAEHDPRAVRVHP